MNIDIAICVTYDREKDGGLQAFRDKYRKFKGHVEAMQAKGTMPRGHIEWEFRASPPPDGPAGPARILNGPWLAQQTNARAALAHFGPVVVHEQGTPLRIARMDSARLAM